MFSYGKQSNRWGYNHGHVSNPYHFSDGCPVPLPSPKSIPNRIYISILILYLTRTNFALTGRGAVRVSGAVHPGRPLLRALFVGHRVDGRVHGTTGDRGGVGCVDGGCGVGGAAGLRVGTRQVDGRARRVGGGRRRGPSAAVGLFVIRRRHHAGRRRFVGAGRRGRADRRIGGDSGGGGGGGDRGVVTELVEMVELQIV